MIQLRWGDETVWKDLPDVQSVEQAQEMWRKSKAKGGKLPPDPEFREKPDHE